MRKGGAIIITATIPLWLFLSWYVYEIRKSPWGYEFGSMAMPPPTWFRDAQLFGLLSVAVGMYLLVTNFVRWVVKRKNA